MRLEFGPTPAQITAESKTASATFADPSLADLVRKAIRAASRRSVRTQQQTLTGRQRLI